MKIYDRNTSGTLGGRLLTIFTTANRVDSVVDPDLARVGFTYLNATSTLITTRKDRRDIVRTFTYDPRRHVVGMTVDPGFSQPVIALVLRPIESVGPRCAVSPCSADTSIAYGLIDGPRTDVGDSTRYYTNQFGAPLRVVDAFNKPTVVSYDATWPGLVGRVQFPDTFVTKATYSARGNLASRTDSVARVKGVNIQVTSSYAYADVDCVDAVSGITLPGALGPTFDYNPDCNRLWERDGNAQQTTYTYFPAGKAGTKLLATIQAPGIVGVDSVVYDTLGNVSATRSPLGFRTTTTNDWYGRDSMTVTPTDSLQTAALNDSLQTLYDLRGRVLTTRTVGPPRSYVHPQTGFTIQVPGANTTSAQQYDKEGNLTQQRSTTIPDSTGVAVQADFTVDNIGRPRTRKEGGATKTFAYDPAGNVTTQTSGRGLNVTMTYDALNRVAQRIAPEVNYTQTPCSPIGSPDCVYAFPRYPNNGTGYRLYADTAVFTYDVRGRMLTANNRIARVKRSYTKSGWLETDSLRIRKYADSTSAAAYTIHVYGLTMRYDSLGRRRAIKLPALYYNTEGKATRDSLITSYNPGTGALNDLIDVLGQEYQYLDDHAGRQAALWIRPSVGTTPGVRDTVILDADSRSTQRKLFFQNQGAPLEVQSFGHDARGKVTVVQEQALVSALGQNVTLSYTGLGPVVASFTTFTNPLEERFEQFRVDGYGNTYNFESTGEPGEPLPQRTSYSDQNGRFLAQWAPSPGSIGATTKYPDSTGHSYDGSGNVGAKFRHTRQGPLATYYRWDTDRMYYDAADQLRVVQHTSLGPPGNTTADAGSWDEYWYDALGRRVLMRERRNDLSNDPNRRDVIDRFVWDGDQLLYEIRNPGGPGDPLDQTITSGSRFAGVVGYLHGRDLDAPLAVMDSMGRIPVRNWRGLTMGTVRATGVPADCATGATGSCWQVD